MLRKIVFSLCITSISCHVSAQFIQSEGAELKKQHEINVASSSIFDLMGVSSSQISKTSDVKDLKVDWSFKSWRLNPNIAIQGQPVWELFYNRKDLEQYRKANYLQRTLASTDISAGTVQSENSDRRIGGAIRINLFRKYDALRSAAYFKDIEEKYQTEFSDWQYRMNMIKTALDTTTDVGKKSDLKMRLIQMENEAMQLGEMRKNEITTRTVEYNADYWNSAFIDIAGGKIWTYVTDSAGTLKSIRINRQSGWALWTNGGYGIGRKILITGLFRVSFYDEQLSFLIRNLDTGDEFGANSIVSNKIYSYGFNFRYGTPSMNFFSEILFEKRQLKTVKDAFEESSFNTEGNIEVVSGTLKWTALSPYTLSVGGEWRISRNLLLNFGMRMEYEKNWKRKTFQPIAGISCLMR
jgi:hypothetical protein